MATNRPLDLPFRVSSPGPTIAANAQNSMWSPACRFKQQSARLPLIISHGSRSLEMGLCLYCSSIFGWLITMGHAHLAFGNLRSVTSSASCLEPTTITDVRLTPEEDSIRRSDSLMLVADRERDMQPHIHRRDTPSFNCLHFQVAVSVLSKRSLLCFLYAGRSYVFTERGWIRPPSFADKRGTPHILSAVHDHGPFYLEKN